MIAVDVKQTELMAVAYLTLSGPYDQIPEGFDRLYEWVRSHDLMPAGPPRTVYLTAPNPEVDEKLTLWELRAPVVSTTGDLPPDDHGFGVKHVPAQTVASAMHLGPYETIEPTYEAVDAWISENGYVIVGAPEEIYLSDPTDVPAQEYLTEIQFPIARIQ